MYYESGFISETLKSMQEGDAKAVPGLIIRLLNKSLPHFVEVLNAFINKSIKSLEDFEKSNTISVKAKLIVLL